MGQPKRFTTLPPLAQRMLPNLDIIIEGKTLLPTAKHSAGVLELQKGYDWTGDGQVRFMPADEEPILEMEFAVEKEGYRGLILRFTYAEDYGVYRVFLDGKNIGEPADYMVGQKLADCDFYSPTLQVKENYLGSYQFTPGKHTLRLVCIGRNPLSKGRTVGLDSIRLRERWIKQRKPLQ